MGAKLRNTGVRPRAFRRGRLRLFLLICVGLYATVWILITVGCADRLVLFPTTEPLDTTDLERRTISVPGGGTVEAFVAKTRRLTETGEPPKLFVLSFTGNAARAARAEGNALRELDSARADLWAKLVDGK